MAWPATTSDSLVSGRGVETDGADIFERMQIGYSRPMTWTFAETDTTTTLADVQSITMMCPPWLVTGSVLTLSFLAKRDAAASGNASFRLQQGATNGTTNTTALTATFSLYSVSITAPDDSWANSMVTFDFQAQRPASGVDSDWQTMTKRMLRNFNLAAP